MKQSTHAQVTVQFLRVDAGGRSAAIDFRSRNYMPHFRVADGEHLGVVFVDGPSSPVSPGEVASVVVRFLYSPPVSYADLRAGSHFEVMEGSRVVATGVVDSLLSGHPVSPDAG